MHEEFRIRSRRESFERPVEAIRPRTHRHTRAPTYSRHRHRHRIVPSQRLPVGLALVLDAKKYTYLSTPLTTTFDDEKKLEMACCVNMFSTSYSHFGRGFKVVVLVAGAYQSRRKKKSHLFIRQAFRQRPIKSV